LKYLNQDYWRSTSILAGLFSFSIFSINYLQKHIEERKLRIFYKIVLTCWHYATTTSWMWRSSFDHHVKILSQVIWYILIKIYRLSFAHVFAWNPWFSTSVRKQWKHPSEYKNSNKLQMTLMSTLIGHKAFWQVLR
jgi:hypothetical protein